MRNSAVSIYIDGAIPTRSTSLWEGYPDAVDEDLLAMLGNEVAVLVRPNTSVLRTCVALNHTGRPIPDIVGKTVSGADSQCYLSKAKDLIEYLTVTYGTPAIRIRADRGFNEIPVQLRDYQGVLALLGDSYNEEDSLFAIWNGETLKGVNGVDASFKNARSLMIWPAKEFVSAHVHEFYTISAPSGPWSWIRIDRVEGLWPGFGGSLLTTTITFKGVRLVDAEHTVTFKQAGGEIRNFTWGESFIVYTAWIHNALMWWDVGIVQIEMKAKYVPK